MPGNAAKNQNAAKKGKSGMPRISVIILNWNGRKIIGNCLKSVFQQAVPPHEVIVVDNGSTDGSQEFVKTRFRQARLVELKANKGFAEGNNQGIRKASSDWVFVLNNDAVLDKDCLKKIGHEILKDKKTGDSEKVGMYSTNMVYMDTNRVDSLGLAISKLGLSHDIKEESNIHKLKGPCGGAAIYSRKMLESLKDANGYYDRDFFIYFEDADLAWRASREGWKCRLAKDAIVHHMHGETTRKMKDPFLFFFIRNRVLSFKKNNELGLIGLLLFLALQKIVLIKYLFKGKFFLAFSAIIEGFSGILSQPKEIFQ